MHVAIFFVLLLALFHTIGHVFFYGTGVSGVAQKGVSGFSIGDTDLADDVKLQAQEYSPLSRVIIIFEWVLLIGLVGLAMARGRVHNTQPLSKNVHLNAMRGPGKTDLDVLYDLLKEEKRLSLSTIAKTFAVSNEVVESWCKILESGNLGEVHYPRLGEPELRLL